MRLMIAVVGVAVLCSAVRPAAGQVAHMKEPVLGEDATKVSDHVWEITGFPNVAIVVGSTATLVVDTGLGPRNGATVARVAARLAPANKKLYLTTTHYHPEHAAGEGGFPPHTILVRAAAQQRDADRMGREMIDLFRGIAPLNKELLAGVDGLRSPDMTFDREATLDLGGGVTARLLWYGGGHTPGDELVLVEPDRTLVSGDLVQNKTVPYIYFRDTSTPSGWLAVLDQVAKLDVAHVVPDHSPPGDGSLVAAERDLITAIRTQALTLKRQGVPAAAAGRQIDKDLRRQHPDYSNLNGAAEFVKAVYNDTADPATQPAGGPRP